MNNKPTKKLLFFSLALLVGLYTGTHWNTQEISNTESDSVQKELISADQKNNMHDTGHPVTFTVSPIVEPVLQTKSLQSNVLKSELMKKDGHIVTDTSVSGFDRSKLETTYQQIYSEDAEQRHQAVQILAQLGEANVIPELIKIATNEEEDSKMRRDLIQQLSWSNYVSELNNIITHSRDAEVRLAAINAVESGKIGGYGLINTEEVMLENLRIEPEDGIKIATLNHFLSTNPEKFHQIVAQYSQELSSPSIQNYLKMVTTPPAQATDVPLNDGQLGG
ncbi:MAG: hypothetical protein RI964_2874 [Pseudomonadota bacterium]|jgi:hypothetical protein